MLDRHTIRVSAMLQGAVQPEDRQCVIGSRIDVTLASRSMVTVTDHRADNAEASEFKVGRLHIPYAKASWLEVDELSYCEFDLQVAELDDIEHLGDLRVSVHPPAGPEGMPDWLQASFRIEGTHIDHLLLANIEPAEYLLTARWGRAMKRTS